MHDDHNCWWARRRETELCDDGLSVSGAGVPLDCLREAAAVLGVRLHNSPSAADECGEDIILGDIASGATHDDCFFKLLPPLGAPEASSGPIRLDAVSQSLWCPRRRICCCANRIGSLQHRGNDTPPYGREGTPPHRASLPNGNGFFARLRAERVVLRCSDFLAVAQ